jgi:transposase InsO family protein
LTRRDDVPQVEGGDVHSAPPAYGTAGTRLPARQLEFLAFVIDAFSRRVVGWQLAGLKGANISFSAHGVLVPGR